MDVTVHLDLWAAIWWLVAAVWLISIIGLVTYIWGWNDATGDLGQRVDEHDRQLAVLDRRCDLMASDMVASHAVPWHELIVRPN